MDPGILIRAIRPEDAQAFFDLKLALDSETSFMMFEPGERLADITAVVDEVAGVLASDNSMVFVADAGRDLAGYVEARGGDFRRNRHSAMVFAGVRQSYAGQGLGSRLFQALVEWAPGAGVVRLELTVMAHNNAAIHLYEKFGFETEGVRHKSLRVDGEWVDEIAMARVETAGFADMGSNG